MRAIAAQPRRTKIPFGGRTKPLGNIIPYVNIRYMLFVRGCRVHHGPAVVDNTEIFSGCIGIEYS